MRHQESQSVQTPFDLWVLEQENESSEFFLYQALVRKKWNIKRYIASFVVTPEGSTLFVGIYEKRGNPKTPSLETIKPLKNKPVVDTHLLYDLSLTEHLSEYRGRLFIDWGRGTRAWVQNADNESPKGICEIRKERVFSQFPGFDTFAWPINDLDKLPHAWREVLRNSQGVYLLTCLDSGKRYVGSAYGEERFLGRWQHYYKNGHGGNKQMIRHKTSGYQVSVLEVAASGDDAAKIIARETTWKERLLTRHPAWGLNSN